MNNSYISQLVSVIIPCYNHGKYLGDAINSVLTQSYKHVEIIVVDAGSDDPETQEILSHLQVPDLKVIKSGKRIYPSEARNIGYRHARGNFIVTLDADDILENTFLAKTSEVLRNNNGVGAASCKVVYFGYEDGFLDYTGGSLEDVLQNMGSHLCAMIRKEAWNDANGFDDELIEGFEDWEFWIRLTKKKWSIYIIPEVLFYYRQKKNSRVTDLYRIQDDVKRKIKDKHADVYSHPFDFLVSLL